MSEEQMNEEQKQRIMQCMYDAWVELGMRAFAERPSLEAVHEFMHEFGVDTSKGELRASPKGRASMTEVLASHTR